MTGPIRVAYRWPRIKTKIALQRIALCVVPKRLGRAQLMESLAHLLYARFRRQGTPSDLDEALELQRHVLELRPEGHPDRAISLRYLATYLYSRFKQLRMLSDLDEALAVQRHVLDLYPEGHPHHAHLLGSLARFLHSRFRQRGMLSDLNEALALQRHVLELCPEGHPSRARSLARLVLYLHSRFEQLRMLSDLDEVLTLQRHVLELRSQRHPDRAILLGGLAYSLHARFEQLGTLSDLNEAISLQRHVLELRPEGHPSRAISLGNLTLYLHSRFKQLGILFDLDEAIVLERHVLELRPEGHPDRATSLGSLALYLHSRFKQLGVVSNLDEAITLQRCALELRSEGHPDRVISLGDLAIYLHSRFEQLGLLSDLNEALVLQRHVLELCPEGHPHRVHLLGNLARSLHSRFKRLGILSDLDKALALQRRVLELRPEGHPHRPRSLGCLARPLHSRSWQLGTLSDLDEAITLQRRALKLLPEAHPGRATSLGNLSRFLHSRFEQLGMLSDLDEALALQRRVLELRPEGHPHRAYLLGNLALYLHSRFEQLGMLSDLDEALGLQRHVLELRQEGHPHRAHLLGNLALYLHSRFEQLRMLSDLDEALAVQRQALELRPEGHPNRAPALGDLAFYLHSRFEQLGAPSDLEEALTFQRHVLELCPEGYPHRPRSLGRLAGYLHTRFKHSTIQDIGDLQEMFKLYAQLSQVPRTVFSADLKFVKNWVQAAEACGHSTAVLGYQTLLRLSVHHLATLPTLPKHLILLKQLTTSTAVDAFSACVRRGKHADAVELLEQGRGICWTQLLRLRSPLAEVVASGDKGKQLADKFIQLASLLRTVLDTSPNAESQSQQDSAYRLNIQFQDVVDEIRKLPGLSRFLQSPLFSDLQIAASGGPVLIVNASQYSCDALIVLTDRDPIHIALPITKAGVSELSSELYSLTSRAKFRDVTRELLIFLRQLWDVVVFPIVKILQKFCPHGSRIWWCPTAEFSPLPLHAAGSFRKAQPTFSDLYISSYTPTLTTLLRARQQRSLDPPIEQHRFSVVGQAQAPGQCELISVNAELSTISQRIGAATTLTCVQDQDATIPRVAEELEKCAFVHLACHGIPDRRRPFESGFALGDGLFKVEDIMRYDLQNAQFAYLSACHTTAGDEESPDEVIHLAAAMQFAGFRSVIGTMWAVDDAHTNEITSRFYEYMLDESGRLDHTRAALALHQTMHSLRSSKIPLDQRILYIHIGA